MTTQSMATGMIRRTTAGLALTAPALRIADRHAGSGFRAAYPGYATTARLDELRAAADIGGALGRGTRQRGDSPRRGLFAYPAQSTTSVAFSTRCPGWTRPRRRAGTCCSTRLADDETAFEDGTVNFLSIPDVTTGLDWINGIGIDLIHRRVGYLTGWLLGRLASLRHGNGAPLVRLHGPADGEARGGTVAFNFLDPNGAMVDERAVARDAGAAGISVRTGCFCNPGAWEQAFGVTGPAGRGSRWRAFPPPSVATVDDYLKLTGLPVGGAVRVSLGLVSDIRDVERFLDFAERTYRDRQPGRHGLAPRRRC